MTNEIFENLKNAVLEYNKEEAARLARKAVEEKTDPIKAIEALTVAIRQIGDGFASGELFLPDLVGGAEAMMAAMPILEEQIKEKGMERESMGTVVIGTVFGDIHTIGKTMVATLLVAEGFKVTDLGTNVTSEAFIKSVEESKPNILAMSALMTTTAPEQRKVISILKEKGLRDKVKVMVGGGAVTQEFADEIGADGFDVSAPGAARLARALVQK